MLALLVDGLNLVRRVYAGVPGDQDTAQHADDALHSCVGSARRALQETAASHALCVFDASGENWRHALWPAYKAERPPMPAPLTALMPRIETAFEELGLRPVRVEGFEAEDVLASIAVKIAAHGGEAVILCTDKSMASLLGDGIRVRNHFDSQDVTAADVQRRFGVLPSQLITWLALVGDHSQGVPGVRSVGAKTAARLIGEHGTLEAILAAAGSMQGRLGEALRDGADDARLSFRLVTLRTDVEVGLNLAECRVAR